MHKFTFDVAFETPSGINCADLLSFRLTCSDTVLFFRFDPGVPFSDDADQKDLREKIFARFVASLCSWWFVFGCGCAGLGYFLWKIKSRPGEI